jgi:hypothetical protein
MSVSLRQERVDCAHKEFKWPSYRTLPPRVYPSHSQSLTRSNMAEEGQDTSSLSTLQGPLGHDPTTSPNRTLAEYLAEHGQTFVRLQAARDEVIILTKYIDSYIDNMLGLEESRGRQLLADSARKVRYSHQR